MNGWCRIKSNMRAQQTCCKMECMQFVSDRRCSTDRHICEAWGTMKRCPKEKCFTAPFWACWVCGTKGTDRREENRSRVDRRDVSTCQISDDKTVKAYIDRRKP